MIWTTFVYFLFSGTLNGNITVTELKTDAQMYTTSTSITYVFE
jgi:hypothetical protein